MDNKLTTVEQAKAEYFLLKYPELHNSLDFVSSEIERLQKEKDKLVATVDLVRKQDEEFMLGLKGKYGVGEIDAKEMIYKT